MERSSLGKNEQIKNNYKYGWLKRYEQMYEKAYIFLGYVKKNQRFTIRFLQ